MCIGEAETNRRRNSSADYFGGSQNDAGIAGLGDSGSGSVGGGAGAGAGVGVGMQHGQNFANCQENLSLGRIVSGHEMSANASTCGNITKQSFVLFVFICICMPLCMCMCLILLYVS